MWHVPAVDLHNEDDNDSGIGSYASTHSTYASLRIYNYRLEHGRRYHALHSDSDYQLPNDDVESDRLDLQHHLFRMTLDGKLHCAPLHNDVHQVLDIGTGTGLWAIEFAEEYPSAAIVGIDLSPTESNHIPPNCRFYVEDAESDWNFDHEFDYIHGRMLVVGIKDFPKLFQQAYNTLKPGGWIEMQDITYPMPDCKDGTAAPDSPLMVWADMMRTAASIEGLDLKVAGSFPQMLQHAGFVNIQARTEIWPLNRWPEDEEMKARAVLAGENFSSGMEGFCLKLFTRCLGWPESDVLALVEQARSQVKDNACHTFIPMVDVWAQKPDIVAEV